MKLDPLICFSFPARYCSLSGWDEKMLLKDKETIYSKMIRVQKAMKIFFLTRVCSLGNFKFLLLIVIIISLFIYHCISDRNKIQYGKEALLIKKKF